jgi:hypothetical protein
MRPPVADTARDREHDAHQDQPQEGMNDPLSRQEQARPDAQSRRRRQARRLDEQEILVRTLTPGQPLRAAII